LGHIVSENGVETDPKKTRTVLQWPLPKSKNDLQSFLGLCGYYRRFITGFSKIAPPLFQLTEKKSKFVWNPDCANAFKALKLALTEPPILTHATETDQFILDTDASNECIGVSKRLD
jgi:RNase H-like domain found in reverse transcriptase